MLTRSLHDMSANIKRCVGCESFRILYEPIKDPQGGCWDSGLARCDKHDLVCDFTSARKLNRLVCVEEQEKTDER